MRNRFFFLLLLLAPFGALAEVKVSKADCRDDGDCILVQESFCRTISAIPAREYGAWQLQDEAERRSRTEAGDACGPILPSKLLLENHFPVCFGGTCTAATIPGKE